MKKLLIATTNPGKFQELSSLLTDIPINLVSLKDLYIAEKADETGKTFQENAIIKAKFYQQLSKLPTLADDGGFEIDALNEEPGVNSHRWVDTSREATDAEIINKALNSMKDVPLSKRQAQLRLVIALALSKDEIYTAEAKIRGIVANKPAVSFTPGFPFRALLFLPQINKYYNELELTDEENKRYNHRRQAIEIIKPIIIKSLVGKFKI